MRRIVTRRGERGLTLPELLVVILLMGAMSVLGIMGIGRNVGRNNVDRFANDVRSAMLLAGRRALTLPDASSTACWLVAVTSAGVTACAATTTATDCTTAPRSPAFRAQSGPDVVVDTVGLVYFFRNGVASSGNDVRNPVAASVKLHAASNTEIKRLVTVLPFGRPRVTDSW